MNQVIEHSDYGIPLTSDQVENLVRGAYLSDNNEALRMLVQFNLK